MQARNNLVKASFFYGHWVSPLGQWLVLLSVSTEMWGLWSRGWEGLHFLRISLGSQCACLSGCPYAVPWHSSSYAKYVTRTCALPVSSFSSSANSELARYSISKSILYVSTQILSLASLQSRAYPGEGGIAAWRVRWQDDRAKVPLLTECWPRINEYKLTCNWFRLRTRRFLSSRWQNSGITCWCKYCKWIN